MSQEEKNRIDEKDKFIYSKPPYNNSLLRSYYNEITDSELVDPNEFTEEKQYSSIKFGKSNKLNWFICPKIFDLKTNQSLDWSQLIYDKIAHEVEFNVKSVNSNKVNFNQNIKEQFTSVIAASFGVSINQITIALIEPDRIIKIKVSGLVAFSEDAESQEGLDLVPLGSR